MSELLWQALRGKLKPADALNAIDQRWQALHRRHGFDRIATQWQSVKSRYPSSLLDKLTS